MGMRGVVDVSEKRATAYPQGSCIGVETRAVHGGQVDDHTAVACRLARKAVATAPNSNQQTFFRCEADGVDDIAGGGALCDQRWRLVVEHAVPDAPGRVVGFIGPQDDPPTQLAGKLPDCRELDGDLVSITGNRRDRAAIIPG